MSRRKQNGDQEFGSDSFLDIIANIVGILIILIVIAGMKVARQPASSADTFAHDLAATIPVPEEAVQPEEPSAVPSLVAIDDVATQDNADVPELMELPNPFADLSEEPTAESPLESTTESATETAVANSGETAELTQQIESLTLQIENAGLENAATDERLAEMLAQLENQEPVSEFNSSRRDGMIAEQQQILKNLATIEGQLSLGEEKQQGIEATLTSLTDRQQYITQALKQVSQETRQLRELLDESEQADPSDSRLQHRISPVSRDAMQNELHFQLAGGKVAHIPLDRLLQRLKAQVSQRRKVVQKFYRSEGIVGPIGGFRMNYLVERQTAPPLQSLQYGGTAFRIVVSRWTILPAETLEAETIESAVKIGSRFRQVVESAEPNTVLTIWVYPEDFDKFGELRELGHRFSLRVAARPLPAGTPIAGSPGGSRSSSQ